jgi:hypothetical protein
MSYNSLLVIKNKAYYYSGQTSGNFITGFGNSLGHSIKDRAIVKWYLKVPFNEVMRSKIMSDDGASTINPKYKSVFTSQILADKIKEQFFQTRTPQDKSDGKQDFEDLEVDRFLQRRFLERDGMVLAPLNPDSIKQMVQWIEEPKKDGPTFHQQFKENCHTALREWAIHGRKEFNHHKRILNAFLRAIDPSYQFTKSFEDVYEKIVQDAKS